MREKIKNMIKEVLEKTGLICNQVSENIIKVTTESFFMGIEMEKESLRLEVFSTEEVKTKYEKQMLKFLNLINLGTKEGQWVLDEDRTVCHSITVDFQEEEISKEYIENIIMTILLEQKIFETGIKAVSMGISSAEEAYKEALYNLQQRKGVISFTSPQVGVTFEMEEGGLDYRLQVEKEVPANCLEDMLWYLNQANLITRKGHWELAGNHVFFRIHTECVVNKEVSEKKSYEASQRGEAAIEKFYEGIMMICAEGFSGPEAFEEFVVKQSTDR